MTNKKPQEIIKDKMIEDIDLIVDMINTFIPANDDDRKKLLIGESMLTQLRDSLESAETSAELSKVLDVNAIREDWDILQQQLNDTNINKSISDWKHKILDSE